MGQSDTPQPPSQGFEHYGCAEGLNEAGGEVVYTFELSARGVISAGLDDVRGDEVDVDLHLLDQLDPSACLARGNISVTRTLEPGRYYLVVDTWVDGAGAAHPGPYRLEARAIRPRHRQLRPRDRGPGDVLAIVRHRRRLR